MFIRLNKRRGQSTLEYGVIIAVVVGALIAMQVYVKRGLQGKMRQAADEIGEQYSPGYTTSKYDTTTHVVSTENTTGGEVAEDGIGAPKTTSESQQIQTRKVGGYEKVADSTQEYWGE